MDSEDADDIVSQMICKSVVSRLNVYGGRCLPFIFFVVLSGFSKKKNISDTNQIKLNNQSKIKNKLLRLLM